MTKIQAPKQPINTLTKLELQRFIAVCTLHFPSFLRLVFHFAAPGSDYSHNWHIDLISEYLLAAERKEIKRLIINIPPRFLKSLTCSIAFPAWLMGHDPQRQIMCASYSLALAQTLSSSCRDIIENPLYQHIFPGVKLMDDQNTKTYFKTTEMGHRYAAGVGGTITGFGGEYLIVDDPINAKESGSLVVRDEANRWHDQTWSTRLNNPKTDVMVLIMQRLHMNDVTGHLLEQGGWEHLKIPLVSEAPTFYDFGEFQRDYPEGELLHPDRIGQTEIDNLKRTLGPYGYSGQYQQSPSPEGGGRFRREWLEFYEKTDKSLLNCYMMIDPANSKKAAADYTVMIVIGLGADDNIYVLDIVRDKLNPREREDTVFSLHRKYKPKEVVYEKYGMQVDIDWIRDSMARRSYHFNIKEVGGRLSKEERVGRLVPYFADHRIWFPQTLNKTGHDGKVYDLVQEFIEEEYCAFPVGLHDDMMDALSRLCDITLEWPNEMGCDYYSLYKDRGL